MIRGIFNFSARDGCSTCTMAAFSECSTVAQNRGRAAALDDRMKHMYSESLSMGYILGANNGHSLFTSHLACSGKNCMCSDFASAFLCDTNKVVDLERTSAYLLEDRISCPFVAILVHNDQAAVLSYLSHDEIQVTMLEEGSYSIRDCFLSKLPKDYPILSAIHGTTDFLRLSSQLTDHLHEQMSLWPKADGYGVTMWSAGNDVKMKVSTPTVITSAAPVSDRKKPKGAITAFNYYAMMERRAVSEECFDERLTNNALNMLLGQRWKTMTKEEKAPYQQFADADRVRHKKEMEAFMLEIDPSGSGAATGPARALTAYNHFMHQERQFVLGLNLNDAQTRMGRHAGDRWNNMEGEEKELYVTLNAVEDSMLKR